MELSAKESSDTFEIDYTEQLMTALDFENNLKYIVLPYSLRHPFIVTASCFLRYIKVYDGRWTDSTTRGSQSYQQ